jgi:hypothetical protein
VCHEDNVSLQTLAQVSVSEEGYVRTPGVDRRGAA